jgi:hypothetical protein
MAIGIGIKETYCTEYDEKGKVTYYETYYDERQQYYGTVMEPRKEPNVAPAQARLLK